MSLKISDNISKVPDFYVLKIDKIANELISKGGDIIKLNLGKSELDMSKNVKDEFKEKIYDYIKSNIVDPQGLIHLREEIVNHYKNLYGVNFSTSQVFVNNGTSPIIWSIFSILINKGDSILLPRPGYPSYSAAAEMVYANKDYYNVINGRIDLNDFKNKFKADRTKIVVINSPGNPLGNVINQDEFKEMLDTVNGKAYILSDEIYDGFVYNKFTSVLQVFNPERDKVIFVNGFSKMHHMYTRRLGYAIIPNELIPYLVRFQQHNIVCVDPVTQYSGITSLRNVNGFMKQEIQEEVNTYKGRLEKSENLIKNTKLKIIKPEGSWYLCVDIGNYLNNKIKGSLDLAELLIREAKVAVAPGIDFGDDNIFRISLTNSRSVDGVERMCNFLNSLDQ